MTRHFALFGLAALMCVAATSAAAPTGPSPLVGQAAVTPRPDLQGVVQDDRGQPVAGAVVSALGATAASVVSDASGRFTFRNLPDGPYLVRVHLQGYLPVRSHLVQVRRAPDTVATVTLTLRGDGGQPAILVAGVGPTDPDPEPGAEEGRHDHGEASWRLRHLKRSVLKDAAVGLVDSVGAGGSLLGDSLGGLGWAVASPTRLATSLLADVPLNGQLDLLTTTSFERPQDLLAMQTWLPRGVAFLALEAPTANGHWAMRGALTQGDLSSWVVAGSYRRGPATHRYDAGLSYGAQRYLGGNADALAAVSDGGRNAGALYAYDDWTLTPRISLNYGARYARYDYLSDRALFSPRAGVTLTPLTGDSLTIRATLARRETAPGAEEFIPPASGVSLPPERTFSSLSRHGFVAERLDQMELAAEREWVGLVAGVRVFHQTVDDQILTLFGAPTLGSLKTGLGHYYVASAGDVDATGWGVSVRGTIAGWARASIDYTNAQTVWVRPSPDADALSIAAVARLPVDGRLHDVATTVEGTVPATDTRVFVVYRVNSHFANLDGRGPRPGARFDLQVSQSLPFMQFSGAEWEMLVGLRSLFHDGLTDGSLYDELLVVRSPKRVVGGVTVRF
jgi:hypothetical protein